MIHTAPAPPPMDMAEAVRPHGLESAVPPPRRLGRADGASRRVAGDPLAPRAGVNAVDLVLVDLAVLPTLNGGPLALGLVAASQSLARHEGRPGFVLLLFTAEGGENRSLARGGARRLLAIHLTGRGFVLLNWRRD